MESNLHDYLINDNKVYVDVTEIRDKTGNIKPISFIWEDGKLYEIDRIIDVRPGHSLKGGGYGIRYTVEIRGKQSQMFLEMNRWFIVKK